MTWILILYFQGPTQAVTWAGDFSTQAACKAAGSQWDNMENTSKAEYRYICIEAKRQ